MVEKPKSKSTTTIYVTGNFCDCHFCRGSNKIKTDLDLEAHNAARQGWKVVVVGARNPSLITFDPKVLLVGNESANGNIRIVDPVSWEPLRGIDSAGQEVFDLPDSVHGCWKIRENQHYRLFLRPEYWATKVKIIETRKGGIK